MITIRRASALSVAAILAAAASVLWPADAAPVVAVDVVRSTAVSTMRTTPTPSPIPAFEVPRPLLVLVEDGTRWDFRYAEHFVLCAVSLSSSPSSTPPVERAIPAEVWRVTSPIAYTRGAPCPDGRDRGER